MKEARYYAASCDIITIPTQVNDILINMVNNAADNNAIRATKKLIKTAKVETIFLDSSGYSLLCNEEKATNDPNIKKTVSFNKYKPVIYKNEKKEQVMNITPEHIISAAIELSPDIIATLDSPLRKDISKDAMEMEFQKKLPFNIEMAERTYELKQKYCPNVKLYLPLQIYTQADFVQYTEKVKDLNFDGYAIPYRNIQTIDLAEFMYETYLLGVKNFHIFGTAEFDVLAVSSYVGKHLFDLISWDATSWRLCSQQSEYVNPFDLSKHYIDSNSKIMIKSNTNICSCPWCKVYSFDDIKAMSISNRGYFLRSHNFYVTRNVALELYNNSDKLSDLIKLIKFRNPNNATSIIDVLYSADSLIQNKKKNKY